MVGGFIALVVVILLCFGLLLGVNYFLGDYTYVYDNGVSLKRQIKAGAYIQSDEEGFYEDYYRLSPGKSLGKRGYFEILDETGQVIYCNNPKVKTKDYTAYQLAYMPKLRQRNYFNILQLKAKGGKKYSLINFITSPIPGQEDENRIMVLDSHRKIVYSNFRQINTVVPKEELDYLKKLSDLGGEKDGMLSQQYRFKNHYDQVRYLVVHYEDPDFAYVRSVQRIQRCTVVIFIVLIVLVVLALGFVLSSRMKKSLDLLREAMNDFAEGKRRQIDYNFRTADFEQVAQTFNLMERKLQESEREQEMLQQQKQKMLADISHDLKTPITVITGYVDAIRDGIVPEGEQMRYLDIVSRKASLLSELINSFNDYSRLEHPEYELSCEEDDFCEYVREYAAGKYQELAVAGFSLEAEIPEEKMMFSFDHLLMRRAFENIFSNAIRYCPKGSSIAILLLKWEGQLLLRIADDGPGIPKEIRESVFEPFVVAESARTTGQGSGLGLSISKKIVELHKGSIRILSPEEWEKGTCYEIRFPLS